MPDQLNGSSVAVLFGFFFMVVLVRTQLTYWLARAVATQTLTRMKPRNALMARAQAWSTKESVQRGTILISSWGIVAVPVSFCTFGLKTVVNAAAGLIRMPFRLYLPAMLVGCVIHATIYATIGAAAWGAALSVLAGSPWGALLLLVLIAGAVIAGRFVRQRVTQNQDQAPHVERQSPDCRPLPHTDGPDSHTPQ